MDLGLTLLDHIPVICPLFHPAMTPNTETYHLWSERLRIYHFRDRISIWEAFLGNGLLSWCSSSFSSIRHKLRIFIITTQTKGTRVEGTSFEELLPLRLAYGNLCGACLWLLIDAGGPSPVLAVHLWIGSLEQAMGDNPLNFTTVSASVTDATFLTSACPGFP